MASSTSLNAVCHLLFTLSLFATTFAYSPGIATEFPSWKVVSSALVNRNASELSLSGVNTSSWYTVDTRGTLMSVLLQNNVTKDNDLFYSTNLQNFEKAQFQVPWYYRYEISFGGNKTREIYHLLKTSGVSSRAEIWINGMLVADSNAQAGAYGGREYDISDKVKWNLAANAILFKVYPTDYNRDLALGFVDWNPSPPDNGTGLWRGIQIKWVGQVIPTEPRVVVDAALDGTINVYVDVSNLSGNASATGNIRCEVWDPQKQSTNNMTSDFDLKGGASTKISLKTKVTNPKIWWPRRWGEQPLYGIQCSTYTQADGLTGLSSLRKFGFRTVLKSLDSQNNDTKFFINGEPFQVLGAGYTSDMFLRMDKNKLRAQFEYVLDMGLNTVRLEGKQEDAVLYDLADELGLMILAGWECCDKWEGWSYNNEGSGANWTDADYAIADRSMRNEAIMMQPHPSILGFLVGSDYWPDDRATKIYVDALRDYNWDTPIIASASQRGFPPQLGNGGMKMDGPYDWVPPNYWYDKQLRLGSAAGFGSELGAGVGTPELRSLKKFLSPSDLDDLWKQESADKGLYHMSTSVSPFYTRSIYNAALRARYGTPTSLDDYLLKAQMMDYEATRAQFEAYWSRWNKELARPATGAIYWMLNSAWPSLHWSLFDYYLHPAGAYYGVKAALGDFQKAIYDYEDNAVYVVNRYMRIGPYEPPLHSVEMDVLSLDGRLLVHRVVNTTMPLNTAQKIASLPEIAAANSTVLLRLLLKNDGVLQRRSTYWLSPQPDALNWANSTWYHTPVTQYANFSALSRVPPANVSIGFEGHKLTLHNKSPVPAIFIRLNFADAKKENDIVPLTWSDNYLTLFPDERVVVEHDFNRKNESCGLEVTGLNLVSPMLFGPFN